MRYRLTANGDNDLEEGWRYIAKDNVAATDRFIDAMAESFTMLASLPQAIPSLHQ